MWPVREIPLLSLERVLDTEVTSNGKEAIQRKIQRLLKVIDEIFHSVSVAAHCGLMRI